MDIDRQAAAPRSNRNADPEWGASCSYRVLSDTLKARTDLSWNDKGVLMTLSRFGQDDPYATVGVERIAREAGISERTVQRSLGVLAKAGLIRVEEDRSLRTHRRIHKLWMDDPSLHPHKVKKTREVHASSDPRQSVTPPRQSVTPQGCQTVTQENQYSENQYREPMVVIGAEGQGPPPRSTPSQDRRAGKAEAEPKPTPRAEPQPSDVELEMVVVQAETLFGGNGVAARAKELAREVGAVCVMHALRKTADQLHINGPGGRKVHWSFTQKVARDAYREGGAISEARKPAIDSGPRYPIHRADPAKPRPPLKVV